jgi:hypothetical protein
MTLITQTSLKHANYMWNVFRYIVSIFRAGQYVSPKRWYLPTRRHNPEEQCYGVGG